VRRIDCDRTAAPPKLDDLDRAIVSATQDGYPLEPEPFSAIGARIDCDAPTVIKRLSRMLQAGAIRRIGAVPNHYRLGLRGNGMSVWDLDDTQVDALGAEIGALDFVSHCYLRPRRLPLWPYNLFAMVHGESRDIVEAHRAEIAALLGTACRARDILYSTRILKKTGVRLSAEGA
jgi:DNA-binding Lrp family transcriptional regulator